MPEVTADPWAPGVTVGQQGRSQTTVTNVGNVSMQDRTEERFSSGTFIRHVPFQGSPVPVFSGLSFS